MAENNQPVTDESIAQQAAQYLNGQDQGGDQGGESQPSESGGDAPLGDQLVGDQSSDSSAEENESESNTSEGDSDNSQANTESGEGESEPSSGDLFGLTSAKEGEPQPNQGKPSVDPETQQTLSQYGIEDHTDPQQVINAITQAKQSSSIPEELENDPVLQDFIKWRQGGGQEITEFANRYSVPNPEQVDGRTAYQKVLELQNYTQESIEDALDKFDATDGFDREDAEKKAFATLREYYKQQEEARQKAPQQDNQQNEQEQAQKIVKQLQETTPNIVNKKVGDLTITEDMAQHVLQSAINNQRLVVEGGQIDIVQTIEHNFNKAYQHKLIQTARTNGKNESQREQFKDATVPGRNEPPKRSNQPSPDSDMSQTDKAKDAMRNLGLVK